MTERKELPEAWADLRETLAKVFEPPFLAMAHWIDRQIQRSPRLHRWLSR